METLVKFIKDNDLKFDGRGSALNSDCCIAAGFADHLGITDSDDLRDAVKKANSKSRISLKVLDEIDRVFDFAYTYNYGNFWKTPAAKRLYKF